MEHKADDYSAFHSIDDGEEYEYSYDASGYVVGCWVIKDNNADDIGVDAKGESSVDFIPDSEYDDPDFEEEVEQPLQMGSDDNISYEYDASGYFVGCRVKKGCETEVLQIDSTFSKDDVSGGDDDGKSGSSVNFVPKYSPSDDDCGLEYVNIDSDEEVEELQDKEASFEDGDTLEYHEHLLEKSCDAEKELEELKSDDLSYSFDASGYFVGCRVKKGCELEEVQSDAKCNGYNSDSEDSVKFRRNCTWLCDSGEKEAEEIQEAVFDNFDMMLNNVVSEADQTFRPILKRKAEDAEIGEGQIVSCLMAGQDCPWRDSRGQLKKRTKPLKY